MEFKKEKIIDSVYKKCCRYKLESLKNDSTKNGTFLNKNNSDKKKLNKISNSYIQSKMNSYCLGIQSNYHYTFANYDEFIINLETIPDILAFIQKKENEIYYYIDTDILHLKQIHRNGLEGALRGIINDKSKKAILEILIVTSAFNFKAELTLLNNPSTEKSASQTKSLNIVSKAMNKFISELRDIKSDGKILEDSLKKILSKTRKMFDTLCYSTKSFEFYKKFLSQDIDHNIYSFLIESITDFIDSNKNNSLDKECLIRKIGELHIKLDQLDHEIKMNYDFNETRDIITGHFKNYIAKNHWGSSSNSLNKLKGETEINGGIECSTLSSAMIYSPFACSSRIDEMNFYRDNKIGFFN